MENKKNQRNDSSVSKTLKKSNQTPIRLNLNSRNKGSPFLLTLSVDQTPSLSSKTVQHLLSKAGL